MMNKLLKCSAAVPIILGTVAGLTGNANAADLTGCTSGAPLCTASIRFDYTTDPLIFEVDGQTQEDVGGILGTPLGLHFATEGGTVTSGTFNDVNEVDVSSASLGGSAFDGASDWEAFLRDFALTDAKNQVTGPVSRGAAGPSDGVTDGNYLIAFTSATASKEYLMTFSSSELISETELIPGGGTGLTLAILDLDGTVTDPGDDDIIGTSDDDVANVVVDITLQGITGDVVEQAVNDFYGDEDTTNFDPILENIFINNGFSGTDTALGFAPSGTRTVSGTINITFQQSVPEPGITLGLLAVGSLGLFGKAVKRRI